MAGAKETDVAAKIETALIGQSRCAAVAHVRRRAPFLKEGS